MPKPKVKICECGRELGQKVRTCPDCKHKFVFKKSGKYEEIKEWRKLPQGAKFILRKGSRGPYYTGEKGKILMGYRGTYTVGEIRDEGIVAYSNEGMAFIYMGKNYYCEKTMIFRRKYRLYKRT